MTGPALYRHRPTIIHALQLTPDTVDDIRDWLDQAHQGGYHISDDNGHLLIETIEGDRDILTEDGYWIVQGVAGEFYPVRPDIFARTYEPASHGYTPPEEARCGSPCEHGGTCTAPAGHTGFHATYARDGTAYCTWPQRPAGGAA